MQLKTDSPATFCIMTVMLINSTIAFLNKGYFFKMILHPYSVIKNKEYNRWLTADLVHNGYLHLLLNEIFLYLVCSNLEYSLRLRSANGSLQFLIIYLSSSLSGAIATTILHKTDFDYSTAGASGSIFGCMMSFMILKPFFIAFYLPIIGAINNIYTALIYSIIFIVYQRRSGNSLVSNEVHLFGACGGALISVVLFYGPLFVK